MSGLLIRMGGARALSSLGIQIVVVLVLSVGLPLFVLWPFGKTHAPQVEIHDEVNILNEEGTRRTLEDIRFRKDVRLAVVTLDADYNENFNSVVLNYARNHEPSWIDARDPNYWADGLIILAVSPTGRWVGVYFGEDVKVSLGAQEYIQDSAKGHFRDQNWAGGIEKMAQTTANSIGRPVSSQGMAILLCVVGWLIGFIMLARLVWIWTKGRRNFAKVRRHYTQVTTDYEATQINAELIPTEDAHGAQVLARFSWFEDQYAELTRALQDFGEPRGAAWLERGRYSKARDMAAQAQSLDSLDDAIANTAALLTLSGDWRKAWNNELGPIYEDLAALNGLCESVRSKKLVDVEPERILMRESNRRLAQMTMELEKRELAPGAALDEVDKISKQVSERANALARRALRADTSEYRSKRMAEYRRHYRQVNTKSHYGDYRYRGKWSYDGYSSSYDPAATIRINPSSPGAKASRLRWTKSDSSTHFSTPVSSLVTGYSEASTYSPSSSSSSSSSSSWGSSGGGFSGAGSSSHF